MISYISAIVLFLELLGTGDGFATRIKSRAWGTNFPLYSTREEPVVSSNTRKSKPEISFPYDSKKIRNFSIIAHIDQ